MTYELTNQEKIEIINQHIKNLNYSLYNLQISLKEELAIDTPNQDSVSSINQQIADNTSKKSALIAELELITE